MNTYSDQVSSWWYIVARPQIASENYLEEPADFLFVQGAAGTIEVTPDTIGCYFQGTEAELESFVKSIEKRYSILETTEVEDRNWVQECNDVWQPLTSGSITVTPVMSEETVPERKPGPFEIFLIPGTGFGTGHHDTTAGMMFLLENSGPETTPLRILDVGTGSGILSLAASLRFPEAEIIACDICSQALENAAANIRINDARIELREGSISQIEGSFDLIMANIYPEVLQTMEEDFYNKLQNDSLLFLSGIMGERLPLIEQSFGNSPQWQEVKRYSNNNWFSLAYRKHC